jgi:ADP-ribosylglycohydrolase
MAMDLARNSAGLDRFVEGFYATMLDRSFPTPPGETWDKDLFPGPTSREVLPAVVGIFYLCEGEPDRCIVEGASFGRDADTIAGVVGGLAGALRGAGAIREDWIEECERANEGFFAEVEGDGRANFRRMATRLVGAVELEMRTLRERLETLSGITRRADD